MDTIDFADLFTDIMSAFFSRRSGAMKRGWLPFKHFRIPPTVFLDTRSSTRDEDEEKEQNRILLPSTRAKNRHPGARVRMCRRWRSLPLCAQTLLHPPSAASPLA